jgi:3-keto steroid reductase
VTFVYSGVGFGICQRLLSNFCGAPLPTDALPQPQATPGSPVACEYTPTAKLTLILACRNPKKATAARDELLQYVDKLIVQQQNNVDQKQLEHAKEFRKNLEIDLLKLDLASSASAFNFCDEVSSRYGQSLSFIMANSLWIDIHMSHI